MILTRFVRNKKITLGRLTNEDFSFYTVERPWLGNKQNISCIPDGNYTVKRVDSPQFGPNMWEITNVPNRFHILLHIANYPWDVEGCIGLGIGLMRNLRGVGRSKAAIAKFYAATEGLEEFDLTIITGALGDRPNKRVRQAIPS